MLPPNPADLATEHAAALAAEAERVFQYLADVATAAAELADGLAFDADYLAETAPEGPDRESAEGYYRQARGDAARAAEAADRATLAVDAAAEFGALAYAAEDVEPAALAEVAAAIAVACAVALEGVARDA